ncbi:Germ cell-less protein-like 1 [Mortierella sp. NVP85]|nr:Germ cell-less protein-like 1 [Mortierella sp. NVP85]
MSMPSTAAGSLAQDLLLAFHDQQLSDITVVAFGQTFHLHRLILLRSGYFRSMIMGQAEWIEKSRQAVTIRFDDPYVTLQAFQRTIHWLYGIDFHYTEEAAPPTFRPTSAPAGTGRFANNRASYQQPMDIAHARHGLGLRQGTPGLPELTCLNGGSLYDNIMMDPSDKIDELLISMYSTASYLNIGTLTDEICSDITRRIRDNRGLIQYMEYAWKLDNGRAWDIILAHCFYQFFWYTYKSFELQDMLVSQSMLTTGLVKVLVSETLWVPTEYERYRLVTGIMLRRLNLETDKLMDWIYDYHEQDWFNVLKELDDDGTHSDILTSDMFLNNLQDWDATSTAEYEDAVGSDHEWVSTEKELRRRSSQITTAMHLVSLEEDRTATPTADTPISPLRPSTNEDDENEDTFGQQPIPSEKLTTAPQSPTLGTPLSSPALSAASIISDTLPRHQVRDLLIFMYLLHHSIHYTHMTFDQLHLLLNDGYVLPARVKDAFWREHQLRRISTSTTPITLSPSTPHRKRNQGRHAHQGKKQRASASTLRNKSSSRSPAPTSQPINPLGLQPIRFSTSLYISRQDLASDRKHYTTSTFYGGSWWSIQVGYNLNAGDQVGMYLNTITHGTSGRGGGSSRQPRSNAAATGGGTSQPHRRPATAPSSHQGVAEGESANGECSGNYHRQSDMNYAYRIYMTTNVIEPPEIFEASVTGRLEGIRGNDLNTSNHTNDSFRPRLRGEGTLSTSASSSLPKTPEMASATTFSRSPQNIARDEMAGEDPFMLNDAWGFKNWPYLTRIARQVRDQPPRSSGSLHAKVGGGSNANDGSSGAVQDLQQQIENLQQRIAHLQMQPNQGHQQQLLLQQRLQQLQQQMQQHNHGHPHQQGIPIHNPLALTPQQAQQQGLQLPLHMGGAGGGGGGHQQQQQQPQMVGPQNNAQPANVNAAVAQGPGAQPPHLEGGGGGGGGGVGGQQHPMMASSPPSTSFTFGNDEADDGLWIHFVVKVGWTGVAEKSST